MKRILKYLFGFILFFFPIFVFAKEPVTLYFFHGDGCPHCAEEEIFLKKLQKEYPDLVIKRYEVWFDEENSQLLDQVNEAFSITRPGVPTNVIGTTIISGYSDPLGEKISRAVKYYQTHEYIDVVSQIKKGSFNYNVEIVDHFSEQEKQSDEELTVDIPFLGKYNLKQFSLMSAAALLGLIDGFNPCAMWILLFLISVLIGMKDRKRMWALGLAFLITSALVYMLIMLSWITIAVKITMIDWVRTIIAIVAIGGGVFNLRSFLTSKESGCDVVDEKKRKKIFKKIRKFTSEKSFIIALVGVIGLAISVNLVELACSAGLPLIFTELLALNDVNAMTRFLYTLVYIFFFLVDDLVVFFIAMFTMKVTGISTKYNKYSHLIGGIIMLIIGVLLILKPGWLMFNFS
ncbi:MAG: hypothetical protein IKF71_04240 [Bacilli bacterium]|nr:hypothetical protein [Bacilli bacterium]